MIFMVLSSWQAISSVYPVHCAGHSRQAQTKSINLDCESAGKKTDTIRNHHRHSARKLIGLLILQSTEGGCQK